MSYRAVILAAGEGRRLKPLTNLRPKPMIPIANRPLLEHVVCSVSEAGIREIVLVVGYRSERIQSHFEDGEEWGVHIEYATQQKQLGTGHAVLQAESFLDDDFLVLNGDRILESELVERLRDEHAENGNAVMAVTSSDEPSEYGVVELEGAEVTGVREKPPAYEARTNIINAGVYGFSPSVFDVIRSVPTRDTGELALTSAIARMVERGTVRAVRSRGIWIDVSHLWDILSVNSDRLNQSASGTNATGNGDQVRVHDSAALSDAVALGRGVQIGPGAAVLNGASIGDHVTIGANAVVSNSVILPDSIVSEGAVVKDAVVAGNARVGPNTTIEGGTTGVVVEGHYYDDVMLGAVIGDNTEVGAGVNFSPGAVVGDGTRIESGTSISGRIARNADVKKG